MKADTSSRPLFRTPAGAITIVSTLVPIAYLAWLYSGYYSARIDTLLSGISLALLYMLAGIFGVYIISHQGFGRPLRLAWFLFSLAAWCYVIAHGLRTYSTLALNIPAFPSTADFFYLLFYPLTLFGVLALSSVFVPNNERTILRLDLFIVLTFFGMVLWYYFLASPLFASTRTTSRYLALIYCIGDVLILSVIIAQTQRDLPRAARRVLGFMATAMVISLVGDSLFAFFEANMQSYALGFLTIIWMCAALAQMMATANLIAYGPRILNDPPARSRPFAHMLRLALPYLAVIVGLALLAIIINTTLRPNSRMLGMLYGSFALVVLVLVRQYVVSKENVRLYQKMQRIAWTDSLTGLYNRHFFNEMLPREIERANRYGNQLSVLLLDIDGFKKYNDTYGHLKGDAVLRTIAKVFSTQLRVSDTIARFGGDEFVVILPETNRRKAIAIASRIRNAVAMQSFDETGLSVSIGVASFRPGMTPEHLLDEADQEMYRRKNLARLEQYPPEENQSVETVSSSIQSGGSFQ
jgi:diguanylate cyclase (GGDEF)-like protein